MCDSIIHVMTFSNNPFLSKVLDSLLWFVSVEGLLVIALTAGGLYLALKGFKKEGWKIAAYLVPALFLLMVAVFGFLQDSIFTDKCEYRSYYGPEELMQLSSNITGNIGGIPLRAKPIIESGSKVSASKIMCADCDDAVSLIETGLWKFSRKVRVNKIGICEGGSLVILEGPGDLDTFCKT